MAILILKVKVVVNDQRGDVGVITNTVTTQVRGDEGEGQEEKDKKPTPFRVHDAPPSTDFAPKGVKSVAPTDAGKG
jgi:hypothetical protein